MKRPSRIGINASGSDICDPLSVKAYNNSNELCGRSTTSPSIRQRSFPAGRRTASRRMPSIRYPSGSSRSTVLSCRDTAPKTRRTRRSPVRFSVTFSSSGNSSARSNGDSSPSSRPAARCGTKARTQLPGRLRSSRSTTVESRRAAIRTTVTDFVRLHSTTGSSTTRSTRHAVRATNAHNNKNRFISHHNSKGRPHRCTLRRDRHRPA